MSPEQAEGKAIDHRSDIFSIGIILYEMATGQRPFKGDTNASLLSAIIKDTPASATEVKPSLPRDLAKIIRRCLAKDRTRRYQTATDVRNELEELKQDVDSGEIAEGPVTASPHIQKKLFWVALSAIAISIVAGAYLLLSRGPDIRDPGSAAVEGSFTQVTAQPGEELGPSLSPDGEFIVYDSTAPGNIDVNYHRDSGNIDIYFQRVDGEKPMNLTEDSSAAGACAIHCW